MYNTKKLENANVITVKKGDLKAILKNFNEIYDGLTIELKRRLNQLLFVEFISYVKRNSNEGEMVIKLQADGTLKTDYNLIKNPKDSGSKLWGGWLREQDSNLQPFG